MRAEEDEDAVKVEGVHTGSWGDLISHMRLAEVGKGPSLSECFAADPY